MPRYSWLLSAPRRSPSAVSQMFRSRTVDGCRNFCFQRKPKRQLTGSFYGCGQQYKLACGTSQQRIDQGAFPGGELQADSFFRGHFRPIPAFRLPSAAGSSFWCEERGSISHCGFWRRLASELARLAALALFAFQIYSRFLDATRPESTQYARRNSAFLTAQTLAHHCLIFQERDFERARETYRR